MDSVPTWFLFDPAQKLFVLRTVSAFYALRLSPSGELLHVGFHPSNSTRADVSLLASLDAYEPASIWWDLNGRPFEHSTFGDVIEPGVALKLGVGPNQERDFRPRYVSHQISLAAPAQAEGRRNALKPALEIVLSDSNAEVDLHLFYRAFPEEDIIERWAEVRNRSAHAVTVDALSFATLHVPRGDYHLTTVEGTWAREFQRVGSPLRPGATVLENLGLNTGFRSNPFFFLSALPSAGDFSGPTWFGALAWGGTWNLTFEKLPSAAVRVQGGYGRTDFELTIPPGDSHCTPSMILGTTAHGLDAASARLHDYVRRHLLPGAADSVRPVLYNSWEASYFSINETQQMTLARSAADLGVELFCVDDGWFGARSNDQAGLGDWVPRAEAFPNGLKGLADEVHRLNMKFGLWVEPEMVNPDSNLFRAHPDWALQASRFPATALRNQYILDLGRPEVVNHLASVLGQLVRDNEIDFLKWDMNRPPTDLSSSAGRKLWQRHIQAVYQLMDRLRRDNPRLEIESCSSGGGRADFAILRRTDQIWTSDNTDAHDRVAIQDGFTLAFPAKVMEAWVTHEKNHQTHRVSTLDLRFDVAMRGALGIGTNIAALSDEERVLYRRKIDFYKTIRPIVQNGRLYKLLETADHQASVWQFITADKMLCVVSEIYLNEKIGFCRAPLTLRQLNPHGHYEIMNERGEREGPFSGFQLMSLGLPHVWRGARSGGPQACTYSRTLFLRQVRDPNSAESAAT